MRYSDDIPREQLAMHASDNMLLFTAVLAVFIGIILVFLGRKGKQLWMVVCSISMGISILMI